MRKTILLSVLLFSVSLFAQINGMKNFPYPVSSGNCSSAMVQFNNNYYMFFYDSASTGFLRLAVSKSSDGNQWSTPVAIAADQSYDDFLSIAATVFKNKITVVFKGPDHKPNIITSADGTTFTTPVDVLIGSTITSRTQMNLFMYASADSLYITSGSGRFVTTADLVTWKAMSTYLLNPCVIPLSGTQEAFIYESVDNTIMLTVYNGTTYTTAINILPADMKGYYPRVAKGGDGSWYVVFRTKVNTTYNLPPWDIAYIKSTDNMATWSQPVMVTSYKGFDLLSSVMPGSAEPIITFFSDRPFFSTDKKPVISYCSLTAVDPEADSPALLWQNAYITNLSRVLTIQGIFANLQPGDVKYALIKKYLITDSVDLYDDGLHGDSLANDNIWGNKVAVRPYDSISYTFALKRNDLTGHSMTFGIYSMPSSDINSSYLFDADHFQLPMNNAGVLGDVMINGIAGGLLDGKVVLYSGGFYLSAVTPDKQIATAVASASRIQDYIPGRVDAQAIDPFPDIFVVRSTDAPFSIMDEMERRSYTGRRFL